MLTILNNPLVEREYYFVPCESPSRSRFYESAQQRYANLSTETWLACNFETVKFPITSSPRASIELGQLGAV